MRIFNLGSINIDHVYEVERFVRPGETLPSRRYARHGGGKGLNQSVAAARAGAAVAHAGCIGQDGAWLRRRLEEEGVNTQWLADVGAPTGHAVIQVDPTGENCIIVEAGANRCVEAAHVQRVLDAMSESDWLLLQNEVNDLDQILDAARRRGVSIALNPAPMTDDVDLPMLAGVKLLFVNALEGAALTGHREPQAILDDLAGALPDGRVVLTLGASGAIYADRDHRLQAPACAVSAVDTTGAGDTFVGYFLALLTAGADEGEALTVATRAAALCVSRPGAVDAIPARRDVDAFHPA